MEKRSQDFFQIHTIVRDVFMRAIFFSLVVTLFSMNAFAQKFKDPIELKKIIRVELSLLKFIDENFEDSLVDQRYLFEINHSLWWNKINKVLNDNTKKYSLGGVAVDSLYAFKDRSEFGLYLLARIDLPNLKSIVDSIGMPFNVSSQEQLESGDFHFLYWEINKNISMWMSKDVFGNSREQISNMVIFVVTNMSIDDLRDKSAN